LIEREPDQKKNRKKKLQFRPPNAESVGGACGKQFRGLKS